MSLAAELALIREAYAALPHGTPRERTAWILQRKRELQAEANTEHAHAADCIQGQGVLAGS